MVNLYVFNPLRKFRVLSCLFFSGSKRILGSVSKPKPNLSTLPRSEPCTLFSELPLEAQEPVHPREELIRDPDYYADSRKGFCTFQVENTLFNVHQVIISREPSAFGDMLCLPRPANVTEGNEEKPVFLTDTVQQFRDFLWALYAPPNDLFLETGIGRLLNVATLANKYCFSSLEAWTIERIYSLAKDTTSAFPLHSAPVDICARTLELSIFCDHRRLQDLVTQVLITRTLWYNASPDTIFNIAKKHGLRTLIGVCRYRELISLERASCLNNSPATQTTSHASMDIEKRVHFLAAHNSLLKLWEGIRAFPPALSCEGCPSHINCELAWQFMWYSACETDELLHSSSADVLGRMKALMLGLRKAMADTPSMTIQCKMSALESITETRDEVIEGLVTHFMEPI